MAEEIVNRVAQSGIEQIDLKSFLFSGDWAEIDMKDRLWNGLVLKEKDFREWVKEHNWDQYENSKVFMYCSEDAIIPSWAYMLITSKLENAEGVYFSASKVNAIEEDFFNNIQQWDTEELKDKIVMIKGCSDIPNPQKAYVEVTKKLQPVVKSLMFGEPCSAVPVYKRKK
ncbi:MAG: DUF2480 family protein [Crocinitomicaceae bacterium]|nr:DUF2480 family protein [Crocinitomicaceae bacterium]